MTPCTEQPTQEYRVEDGWLSDLIDESSFERFHPIGNTEHMRIFEQAQLRVVIAQRKPGTAMPAEEVALAHARLRQQGATHGWGLLVDTRLVSTNRGARFEAAIIRAFAGLLRHFTRISVLVGSRIGGYQARRLLRSDSSAWPQIVVTADPGAALDALIEDRGTLLSPPKQQSIWCDLSFASKRRIAHT